MRTFRALGLGLLILVAGSDLSAAPILSEGFDDITTLAGGGWVAINNSAPAGTTGWFQGNTGVFDAQSGPAGSYIAANFLNAAPGGDISNWLLSPVMILDQYTRVSFHTRTQDPAVFADSLELRISTNGSSTDVGATAASVGDFSTLILSVNPMLNPAGYPNSWTQFTATLSSLGSPVSGRIAIRYVVPDTDNNGDYIGIDTFSVASVPEPATIGLLALGLCSLVLRRARRYRN